MPNYCPASIKLGPAYTRDGLIILTTLKIDPGKKCMSERIQVATVLETNGLDLSLDMSAFLKVDLAVLA